MIWFKVKSKFTQRCSKFKPLWFFKNLDLTKQKCSNHLKDLCLPFLRIFPQGNIQTLFGKSKDDTQQHLMQSTPFLSEQININPINLHLHYTFLSSYTQLILAGCVCVSSWVPNSHQINRNLIRLILLWNAVCRHFDSDD